MALKKSSAKKSRSVSSSREVLEREKYPEFAPVLSDVELVWKGKRELEKPEFGELKRTERVFVGPLQFSKSSGSNYTHSTWTNKIIRGDNRVVMNCLLHGSLKDQIQAAGGIKLVYIDPPFLVGTDYNMSILVGDGRAEKLNVFQEFAYRDSWKNGPSSYLRMMYQRLKSIRNLLADDGSLWVHCDWKANFMIRAVLDEIFGEGAFRNEIIWHYTNKIPDTRKRQYTNATDTILYYAKSSRSIFNWQFEKRDKPIKVSRMKKVDGKKIYPKGDDGKCIYVTRRERTADNVWKIPLLHSHPEMWGYPTQKPVKLLERIIMTSTNEGDLVADFFCGSGTVLEAAERLGRKWIGCDIGKIAMHTCRKRMSNVFLEAAETIEAGSKYFDIFETVDSAGNKIQGVPELEECSQTTIFDFQSDAGPVNPTDIDLNNLISQSSNADSVSIVCPRGFSINSEVIRELLEICLSRGIKQIDVIGFDYDMSVEPSLMEKAQDLSVGICLKKVSRASRSGSRILPDERELVVLAYFNAILNVEAGSAQVSLSDFGLFCRGADQELSIENGKTKSSRILIDSYGQLVRSVIKRHGEEQRSDLTRTWIDWIDHWAVDFDYGDHEQMNSGPRGDLALSDDEPVFNSLWHSYRTPRKRTIDLASPFWKYEEPGEYKIGVKVVDIFGNETIRVLQARIT